jgi:hypothetical protein
MLAITIRFIPLWNRVSFHCHPGHIIVFRFRWRGIWLNQQIRFALLR